MSTNGGLGKPTQKRLFAWAFTAHINMYIGEDEKLRSNFRPLK